MEINDMEDINMKDFIDSWLIRIKTNSFDRDKFNEVFEKLLQEVMKTNDVEKFKHLWIAKIKTNSFDLGEFNEYFEKLLKKIIFEFSNNLKEKLKSYNGINSSNFIYRYCHRNDEKDEKSDYIYSFNYNLQEYEKQDENKENSRSYRLFNKYMDYIDHINEESTEKINPFQFHTYFLEDSKTSSIIIKKEGEYLGNPYDEYGNRRQMSPAKKTRLNFKKFKNEFKFFNDFIKKSLGVEEKTPFTDWLEKNKYSDKSDDKAPNLLCIWNLSIPDSEYLGLLRFEGFLSALNDNEIQGLLDKINNSVTGIHRKFLSLRETEHRIWNKYSEWERKQMATKSAVAAIMSRNMSHNLGSHVITHTRYQIDELSNSQNDELAKRLNGLTSLLQYIQERQDFIAVIANNEKYSKGPLNFKNAVFDFLAMDGPAERHNHTDSDPLKKVRNYLLNNIVSSEGIYRSDFENENNKTDIPIELQIVKYNNDSFSVFKSLQKNQDGDNFNDLLLSVPYGLNGRQALLTIIENIVRNSAKHNKENLNLKNFNKENPLMFSIIFKDENNNEYSIVISDNKKNFTEVLPVLEKEQVIEIKEDRIKVRSLDIIGDKNEIDVKNKGIKEILICLSWLKNREYFEIQEEGKNDELLQIVGINENFEIFYKDEPNQYLSLGYKFTIEKYLLEYVINSGEEKETIPSAFMYKCNEKLDEFKKIYTRIVKKDSEEDVVEIFEKDLKERLGIDELPILLVCEKNNEIKEGDYKKVLRYAEKEAGELDKKMFKKYGENYNKLPQIKYIPHYETLFKETKKQTKEFIELKRNEKFKEGISGSNYTHNLIRKSLKKLDYLKIVEAAYTKVAIVDERIFKKYDGLICPVEEDILKTFFREINSVSEFATYHEKIVPKYKEKIIEFENIEQKLCLDGIDQKLWVARDNFDKFKVEFLKKNDLKKFNYKEEYLKGKNIFIFNCNKEGQLIDLSGNITKDFSPDFLSIHLTLLEAIEVDKDKGTEQKLEKLKENLSANSKTKICVHSGRGGLANIQDIVSFMPLAGVDWALDNCKYVLSELFYGMKY
jgi:hypothetical protein